MFLGAMAAEFPRREAVIFDDGEDVLTYAQLDAASNRAAHGLRELGLRPRDGVCVLLRNERAFPILWWAAMRSGLYFTPINWHLTRDEVRWIIGDSGARAVVFDGLFAEVILEATADMRVERLSVGGAVDGAERLEALVEGQPATPIDQELAGSPMFYSSGTTGRPKGIRPQLTGEAPDARPSLMRSVMEAHEVPAHARYLSPGPLYHSSPSLWSFGMHTIGATAVIMRSFGAELALRLIEHQRVTHSQWVPTMFTRLLGLPEDTRHAYDLSTHREAFHAAAPCPVPVKRAMIEWWGEILTEFYAATEGGTTAISSAEWLVRPGSVGRPLVPGTVHILDVVTKRKLQSTERGLIYFDELENHRFEYHNDAEKTAEVHHGSLVTAGDIGYLDQDGYLFLTDRSTDMIISGGVNIYPREVEQVLLTHEAVNDAAVIGAPDPEFGEVVVAVVELNAEHGDVEGVQAELIDFCRKRLAHYKCPRRVVVTAALPRDPNGKLYKRRICDHELEALGSELV